MSKHRRELKRHRGCKWLHKDRITAILIHGEGMALCEVVCKRCSRRKSTLV